MRVLFIIGSIMLAAVLLALVAMYCLAKMGGGRH